MKKKKPTTGSDRMRELNRQLLQAWVDEVEFAEFVKLAESFGHKKAAALRILVQTAISESETGKALRGVLKYARGRV